MRKIPVDLCQSLYCDSGMHRQFFIVNSTFDFHKIVDFKQFLFQKSLYKFH